MQASRYCRTLAAFTVLTLVAGFSHADAANRRLRHHGHVAVGSDERGKFGRYDPDNIGPYGGRDFGFYGGPNGETTYDYR